MKRKHHYRIMVSPLAENDVPAASSVAFTHASHDDLLAIVARMQASSGLDDDDAAAVAVGLKLLGDVMLAQRANPLFESLREPLHAFIRKLKSQVSQAA